MDKTNYEKAIELIEKNKELLFSAGGVTNDTILKAEERLGIKFPKDYVDFLTKFGALSFGGEEIYGITTQDFDNGSVPNAIWYTLQERKEVAIPNNFLVIYDTGGGELFCMNVDNNYPDNSPIVSFIPGIDLSKQSYDEIAEDFGSFLLDRVNQEI